MIPITIGTKTLSPVMLIKPGLASSVNMLISVSLGKTELKVQPPTDLIMLIDNSGSTGDPLPSGDGLDSKMDKIKEAAAQVIDSLRPIDRLCIITFNVSAETILEFTNCDDAGKNRARSALFRIRSTGGTVFSEGLQKMLDKFGGSEAGREKRGLFLTDGEDQGTQRVSLCSQLKEKGVTIFFGGLGVQNKDEQKMVEMAETNSVKTNFRGLTTAKDVLDFFAEVQAAAATTVIKNAQLTLAPIEGVNVSNLEYVLRSKQLNYMEAPGNRLTVNIGDIGSEEELDFFCCVNVTQGGNIKEGTNAFGKIQLMGEEVGSTTGVAELKKGYLKVNYVTVLPSKLAADPDVKEIMGLASAQRELALLANTTNSAQAAGHLAKAEDELRKTQAFSRGDALAKLAENLKKVQAAAASTPGAAQQAARRATQSFSATERAAQLRAALKKN